MQKYRIKEIIDQKAIIFTNGDTITFNHDQDCCEWNYADFDQLDDLARNYEFIGKLRFEPVNGSGFRFGDKRQMFFVPCYSEQNGYYTDYLEIYLNGKRKLGVTCKFVDC